jgi:C1A family cysteine protease
MENFIGRIDLSERHVWSKYQAYSCETAIASWVNGGCVTTEKMWPHNSSNPSEGYLNKENCFTVLLKATYIDDDLQKMIDSLNIGHPVYIGLSVTKSMMNCDTVVNPTSARTGGGHALAIVGYKLDSKVLGGGYFIVKNSWGTSCGENGYQFVPFQHCLRSDLYCIMWTIDQVDASGYVSPEPTPTPAPEHKCLQWKRIWYMPWKMKCTLYN